MSHGHLPNFTFLALPGARLNGSAAVREQRGAQRSMFRPQRRLPLGNPVNAVVLARTNITVPPVWQELLLFAKAKEFVRASHNIKVTDQWQ